ncbi:hypothetical protein GTV32_18545 [Gordonia sp. SID5947]|uniref:hypothetical protein n=1 Tax=Gordonia sp. SID5947 TaxID=2690315 RepID=UPI00136A5192|nr:hypothetical protein [Gordonia sp. SID5947]MYR08173.1 hypothetical protein [Gordonia sp. SID5947]
MRLAEIASRQVACGLPADRPFLLVDIADDGLLISAIDPAAVTVIGRRVLRTVDPLALDQALAEHLVRAGRVPTPETDDWWNELLELAGVGRERLSTSDGTFVRGHRDVRFFRVNRRDLDDATAPFSGEVSGVLRDMAKEFGASSVALGKNYEVWPGLGAVLRRSLSLPVIVSGAALGDAHDVPVPPVGDQPVLRRPSRVDDAAPPAAPLETSVPPRSPFVATEREPEPTTAARTPDEAGSTVRPHGKRIAIAAAAVVAIIGAGTVTALAVTGPDSPNPPLSSLEFPSSTASPTSSYADPAELAAAQEPAARYAPPPPPTTDTVSDGTSQAPDQPNQRRSAPRRLVIPNPIPGLPPIVLPPLPR